MGSPFHGEAAMSPGVRLCQRALRAQDTNEKARRPKCRRVHTGGFDTHTFAAAGAGFLLAVLWFDLMFDVQTRKPPHSAVLPPEVLALISAYYRRVTTEAYPMNRLVALVMLLTLAAICAEIAQGSN